MKYEDYATPLVSGVLFLLGAIIFLEDIQKVLGTKDLSSEFFTFSSFLFGLILTSYAMLFGVVPSLKKGIRKSETFKDIGIYFRICLFVLLISIVISLLYIFTQGTYIFLANIFFIGADIGFFGYIILLVNDIFDIVAQED